MSQPAKPTIDGKRQCGQCHQMKPVSEFGAHNCNRDGLRHECKACHVERSHWAAVKRKYGLTKNDYAGMLLAQHGVCAICGGPEKTKKHGRFSVDHCHATGKVRALLCSRCNLVLGKLEDSPEICAIMHSYLLTHSKTIRRT